MSVERQERGLDDPCAVNPQVSTCKITGDELWVMMEENLERTFARDPYDQMGGYVKRSMGINLYFKIENPYGHRIQELFVQGGRVRPDRIYDVVFVTKQGVPDKYGTERQELELTAIAALRNYLSQTRQPIEVPYSRSIVAV